jgi:hypothetical protein
MFQEISGVFDKARLSFSRGGETAEAVANDVEDQSQMDRLEELAEYCPQLTLQQRLIGFAVCFSLGCTLAQRGRRFSTNMRQCAFLRKFHPCLTHTVHSLYPTDLIAFFSFRFFIDLVEGHPLPFACNYTFGHILQLLASTFLCGPKKQFK